ncbi:DUF257 family protein [Thermococcus sp. Bubb.Bath]|uniref:DUF257 family protein n=1 Tax=Thermococcus sp. Bubb.Bath TaxID=1638242 RepID=UPI00143AEEDB|nr:DUF257 family protein [Thermococcus sp. Bubb.Bath]
MKFRDYIGGINAGESILVEHTSTSPYPLLFYEIGRSRGWENLLIIDLLDSALPILRWLKFAGLDVSLDKLDRIKAGGTSEWGNKIAEVDPHKDPGIFMNRFLKVLVDYYKTHKNVTTIIVNPERLVPLHENRASFVLYVSLIRSELLGNPSRVLFDFSNFELAHSGYLALLKEIATRVFRIEEGGKLTLMKSIDPEEDGTLLEPW